MGISITKNIIFCILLITLTGCQSRPICRLELNKDLYMDLYEAKIHHNKMCGYTVKVKYIKRRESYDSVIEELSLKGPKKASVVKAFRNNIFSHNLHSTRMNFVFKESREMKVYLGDVRGADWDLYSYAQIPYNKNISVITNIDRDFNPQYRKKNRIKGHIVRESYSHALWSIYYDGHNKRLRIKTKNKIITIDRHQRSLFNELHCLKDL